MEAAHRGLLFHELTEPLTSILMSAAVCSPSWRPGLGMAASSRFSRKLVLVPEKAARSTTGRVNFPSCGSSAAASAGVTADCRMLPLYCRVGSSSCLPSIW